MTRRPPSQPQQIGSMPLYFKRKKLIEPLPSPIQPIDFRLHGYDPMERRLISYVLGCLSYVVNG